MAPSCHLLSAFEPFFSTTAPTRFCSFLRQDLGLKNQTGRLTQCAEKPQSNKKRTPDSTQDMAPEKITHSQSFARRLSKTNALLHLEAKGHALMLNEYVLNVCREF